MPAASHMQIADNDESTAVLYVNDFRLKKETIQIDFERLSFHAAPSLPDSRPRQESARLSPGAAVTRDERYILLSAAITSSKR